MRSILRNLSERGLVVALGFSSNGRRSVLKGLDVQRLTPWVTWVEPRTEGRSRERLSWLLRPLCGFLIALGLFCTGTLAQERLVSNPWTPFQTTWFDRVGVNQGLPHPTATALAQDSHGLIWIGTLAGLVRYDGYHMRIFGMDGGNTGDALPDAYVRALHALPNGDLLVGTNAGGLLRFNSAAQRFSRYSIGADGTVSGKIYALAPEVRGQGVWIATNGGLDYLDPVSNTIRHLTPTADAPTGKAARTFSVMQDHTGNLWVGTQGGLFVRQHGTQAFEAVSDADPAVSKILHDQVWAIGEDAKGRLWVGGLSSGVAYRDEQLRWHAPSILAGAGPLIRKRTVRALLDTVDGGIWVATDGAGVVIYDVLSGQARQLTNDPARGSSLSGDTVRAVLREATGNILAATDLGVSIYDPQPRAVVSLMPSPLQRNGLSGLDVHALLMDDQDRLWVGMGLGHVDVLDLRAGTIRHLRLTGSQQDSDVHALVIAPDGAVLAGSNGIARIDPKTFLVQSYKLPGVEDQPVLFMRRDGTALLFGGYNGAYRYDTVTRVLQHYQHDSQRPDSLLSDEVRNAERIRDAWWFVTSNGISVQQGVADHFRAIRHDSTDAYSLPQDYANALAQDAQGKVWVGGLGGMVWSDHVGPTGAIDFHRLDNDQGLDNVKINAVLFDRYGRLWAAMDSAIAMLDHAMHAHLLGARDGVRLNNHLLNTGTVTPRGDLVFGGLGGLTIIRPSLLFAGSTDAHLAITGVTSNRRPAGAAAWLTPERELQLAADERTMRVDFALLDYRARAETTYSYRLDGLETEWTVIGRGMPPTAVYTNLPYGHYRLQLRATTRGLTSHTYTMSFAVYVQPRWYETSYFRGGVGLLGVLLLFALYHLRTRYLRYRAQQLQELVDMRTRDLQLANQRLDYLAATDELTGIYNRRRFFEMASKIRRDALSSRSTFCMLLIDLDKFKSINDTYGHLAGDEVIRAVVKVIIGQCRTPWLMGRYGGEELMLCLPDTNAEAGYQVAERLRTSIAESEVRHDGQAIDCTVSVGVALWRFPEALEGLFQRADRALYEAKHKGRNCTVVVDYDGAIFQLSNA